MSKDAPTYHTLENKEERPTNPGRAFFVALSMTTYDPGRLAMSSEMLPSSTGAANFSCAVPKFFDHAIEPFIRRSIYIG